MREYDDLCIEAAPQFDPEAIARIRKSVNVSQSVFALYLNDGFDDPPMGTGRQAAERRMLQIVEATPVFS